MSASGGISGRVIGLSGRALDLVMPMHLWVGPAGKIVRAGPTLRKLAATGTQTGSDLFDVIDMRSPRVLSTLPALLSLQGQQLTLVLKVRAHLPLRGVVVSLPAGGGALLNLSLGVSFADAVRECNLTLNDFSPCDQTVDLLYLREAIAATAQESRSLTGRLLQARQQAEEQALTDTLTGLANRRAMDVALARILEEPAPRFGLMHLDLDLFKQVNDTLGHAAGDHVLSHVAAVLRSEIRGNDLVARVGGDEFVLLFHDCDDPKLLEGIAARLIARLEEPTLFDGQECRISASIGTTLSGRYTRPSADRMLNDADVALYASKRGGRGRHTLFRPGLEDGAGASPTH